ncbi:uncharacterized protein LTHEOB_4627 [Lasiodiplodia theobromae]|uniref:uncharacterized protein n=1 Tax=Lasiodiplodia theobromae TaxID=45133 RepID=UPI0015C360A5|nr:uncharacterized protein LTHEOB_4627 [Lasiodiplodia theobromae]KAF4545975.1 hypothetical protein LTHEOB_4627 [Lasiodiplodia theobromae]
MSTPARLEERIDISAIVSDANSLGSSVISVVQTALGSAEAASASSLARSISSVVASAASGPEASSILASLESELASTSRLSSSLLPSGVTATEWSEASVTGSPGRTLSTAASTPVSTAARTSPDPSAETSNGIGRETNHHTAKTTKIALGVSIPLGIILIAFLIFAAYLWGKRTASRQHSKEKNEFASGAEDNNSGEALGHHDDAAHGRPPDEAEDDESRILPPESTAAAPGQKQLEAGVRMTIRHVRHELPSSPDSTMTSSSAAAPWNLQQQRRQQQDDIAEMPTEFNITELPSPVGEVEEFYRYPAGLPAYEQHGRFR